MLVPEATGGVLYKKGVLENQQNSQERNLCWSLYFNKAVGLKPVTFLKNRL